MDAYYIWRMFFSWLVKVFFGEIEVIGSEHIPNEGAIIFVAQYTLQTIQNDISNVIILIINIFFDIVVVKMLSTPGNHQNQFVDPMLIFTHCKRKLGFLIAAKSMSRLVVGYFARQLASIPVVRAQDVAFSGPGKVTIDGTRVFGSDTKFLSDFAGGNSFSCPGESDGIRIANIISDVELELSHPTSRGNVSGISYKIIPKQDHAKVYEDVWHRLGEGGCIGIFPEGGSHDRTDLLPLKAGVSIMALGAMDKYPGLQVQIVPCGLNYFAGHRFRSTVVVEFGKPYKVPLKLLEQYSEGDKREACTALLQKTEQLLRGVTVNVADFATRRMLLTLRKLYQPPTWQLPIEQYMELNRKMAAGYQRTKDQPEVIKLSEKVSAYIENLDILGVTDDHVVAEDNLGSTFHFIGLLTLRLLALIFITIFSIPGLLLNAPIGILARVVAKKQAKKAKAGSVVKIAGTDVMASYKLIIGMLVTPLLYTMYAIFVWITWGFLAVVIFSICWPLFSWATVRVVEEGVRIGKSFLAILKLQWWATELDKLRKTRKELEIEAREYVASIAPEFAIDKVKEEMEATSPGFATRRKHGFMSQKDEIKLNGLRINESYESLEKALMEGND